MEKSKVNLEKSENLIKKKENKITSEAMPPNISYSINKIGNSKPNEKDIYEVIYEIFFHKTNKLGSISKQKYRDYKTSKLGI